MEDSEATSNNFAERTPALQHEKESRRLLADNNESFEGDFEISEESKL